MNIVATSGGFLPDDRGGLKVGPMFDFALNLAAKKPRPRVCLLNTASGDEPIRYVKQYAALSAELPEVEVSHLSLFPMPSIGDVRQHLLTQDLVWVGGGSVVNLLAVWRTHGLDDIFREAWEAGVVLGGVSAGSLCWHVGGTTDSFGPDLRPVTNGLALLPYSNCPHYDTQERRRPLYQSLVASETLPDGWATDDGVGLHFGGTDFVEAISEKEDVYAWRVERSPDGLAVETRIEPRLLGVN